MRLIGYALLVGGVLLCISIVWAAIGFFMMGLGLICLLIAQERNKRFQKLAARLDGPNPTRKELRKFTERTESLGSSNDLSADPINNLPDSKAAWKSLVENDRELARLVEVLAPYGQKYVDELARIYLVFNDKDYLPIIIKKIVMMARKDAGTDVTGELTLISNPHAEATAASARRLREYRARALRAAYDVFVESSITRSGPVETAATGSSLPSQLTEVVHAEGESAVERLAPEQDKSNAIGASNATAFANPKEATRVVYLDTDETLVDLLSDLDLKSVFKAKQ